MTDPTAHRPGAHRRFIVPDPVSVAVAALADLPSRSDNGPDDPLVAACRRYVQLEVRRRMMAGRMGAGSDAGAGDREIGFPPRSSRAVLKRIVDTPATGLVGHRARAAAFLAWDDGDLMGRADEQGFSEDRMLAALVFDLVTARWT